MKTPDTTPTQIVALISAVVGLFVAFGLVDNNHAQAIIGAASVIVPTGLILADSVIRHGRARVLQAPPVIHVHTADSPSAQAVQDPAGE